MTSEAPVKGDKPGFVALLAFAALAVVLGVWWASSGDWGPAIGFGILAIAQVLMAFRARRRDRALDES